LDFYGATFFPTEAIRPVKKTSVSGKAGGGGVPSAGDGNGVIGTRIRELLPVFDASGFTKIAPPTERTVKPRN
jgi:hypothetical protein